MIVFVLFAFINWYLNKKIANNNYLKPAYLGVVFIISIIMSANYLFRNNELKINSAKPVVLFIQENSSVRHLLLIEK